MGSGFSTNLRGVDHATATLGVRMWLDLVLDVFGVRTANAIAAQLSGYNLRDLISDCSLARAALLRSEELPLTGMSEGGRRVFSHMRRAHGESPECPTVFRNLNVLYSFLRKPRVSVETDDLEDFKKRMKTFDRPKPHRFYLESVQYELFVMLSNWEVPIMPKHGPGSTAEGVSDLHLKDDMVVIPPMVQYAFKHDQESWEYHPLGRVVRHARVTVVPKDATSQRIICMEPCSLQYFQQGIARALRTHVRMSPWRHQFPFSDQSLNQRDAMVGSLNGSLATLDLSKASDSIDLEVTMQALSPLPRLRRWMLATRSTHLVFPDGELVESPIFAPMGSGVCFDWESLLFLAILRACVRRRSGRIKDIRVFGDDLIVPSEDALSVIDDLDVFGFSVNATKSYWTGSFRESCGKEYYAGFDVTPIYYRILAPRRRSSPTEWDSTRRLYNTLRFAGYHTAANTLLCESKMHFPRRSFLWGEDVDLHWFSAHAAYPTTVWDMDRQASYVPYLSFSEVTSPTDVIDPYLYQQWLMRTYRASLGPADTMSAVESEPFRRPLHRIRYRQARYYRHLS